MTGQNAWIRATALVMVAGPLAWPLGCSTAYDNESAREGQSATEEAPSEALEESNSRSEGAGRTEGAEDVAESESLIDASDSRSPSETAVSDLTVPAESNPSEGPAAVATSVPEEESVDLLKLVDPTGDAHGGSWTREGSSLVSPTGSRWSLAIPYQTPAEYRWSVVVERISGNSGLSLCLPVGGRQVMVVLDGFGSRVNGLGLVNGRSADRNETTRRGEVFHSGRPTTFVCTVTLSRVHVSCDGQTIIDWTGSAEQLSLDRRHWSHLPSGQLGVACYSGIGYRISRMELMVGVGDAPPSAAESPSSRDVAGRGRFGPGRRPPPWVSRPPDRPAQQPGQQSVQQPPPPAASFKPGPPVEVPEAVAELKSSVCIIEHSLGSGTGFLVGPNLVATNAHVVEGAHVEELELQFSSAGRMRFRPKRLVYEDGLRDLALLEVETELAPIPLAANHVFERGEQVALIGNPSLGKTSLVLRDAVTGGRITAVVHTGSCDFYQIGASVNPGSSGGPVLNLDGEVVGVVAMKATEKGETEIRKALRNLDDSFAAHFNPAARKGIAFGIPVSALSQAIEECQGQSEAAAMRVADRHMAQVLLRKMSILGGIHLIRLYVNVPMGVRQQATQMQARMRAGGIPSKTLRRMEVVPMLPEEVARALASELDSDEVHKVIRGCSANLDQKVKYLGESEHFDPTTRRTIESLHREVLQTNRYAEQPPGHYQGFSQAVLGQEEELKDLIRRLEEQLAVEEPGYSE